MVRWAAAELNGDCLPFLGLRNCCPKDTHILMHVADSFICIVSLRGHYSSIQLQLYPKIDVGSGAAGAAEAEAGAVKSDPSSPDLSASPRPSTEPILPRAIARR